MNGIKASWSKSFIKGTFFFLIFTFLIFSTSGVCIANGRIVYGPESFFRGTGEPVTESRIVDTTGFNSPFTMFVQNGNDKGGARISSAYIWIDGVEILGPSDFSLEVESLKIPVILSGTSKLEVRLTSEEQGSVTILIKEERLQVVLERQNAVTKLITPENGGVLAATGSDGTHFSLQIPPNALPEAQEITITPIADIPDLPFSGGLLGGVHFEPEGLVLFAGATLTITPSSIPEPQTIIPAGYREGGLYLHLYPMLIKGDDLLFSVSHFSGILVGLGNNGDFLDLLNYWRRTEYQYIQRIASILRGLRKAGADLSNLTFAQKVQLWTAFRNWYYKAVLPVMLTTIEPGNTQCDNFDPIHIAFKAFYSWWKHFEILGMESFTPGIESKSLSEMRLEWQEKARSGFENILTECSQGCSDIESFCEKTPRTLKLVELLRWLVISFPEVSEDLLEVLCGGHLLDFAIGIELVPPEASLDIGESVSVITYVKTLGGDYIAPREEAHDISWSLSNDTIVAMEVSGETPPRSATLEGKKEGSTEVIATLRECEQEEPFEGRANITVGPSDNSVDIALVIDSGNATYDYIGMPLWDCAEDACVDWGRDCDEDDCVGWDQIWTDWTGWWGLCGSPGEQLPGKFQVENPEDLPPVLGISLQKDGPFVSGPLPITLTCDNNYVAKTDQLWFKALKEGTVRVGYCIGYTCDPLSSVGVQWEEKISVGTAVPRPVNPPGLRQIGAQVAAELGAKFKNYRFAATAFGAYPEYAVPCSGYDDSEWYLYDFRPLWDTAPYRDFLDLTSSDSTISDALSHVRLICDDPLPVYPPYGGKSVYTAVIHTINDFAWREDAFRTAIVFSVNPACWEYGDTSPYCDTEKGSGYTSQDVIDAAIAANVRLIMINAGWGSYKERMRGPFQEIASQTNGWYTEDYLNFWPMLTAFEKSFQWVLDEEPRLGRQ